MAAAFGLRAVRCRAGRLTAVAVPAVQPRAQVDPAAPVRHTAPAYDLLAVMFRQPGEHHVQLLDELLATVATQFPLQSKGDAAGTPEFNTYLSCVDKLLTALSATGSVQLLQVVASVFCREPGHVREEAMQVCLGAMARRVDAAIVLAAANWLYSMYCDAAFLLAQRKAAVQLMLVPLLQHAPDHVLVDFFSGHAVALIACVSSVLPR